MGRMQRNKGANGEREVLGLLSERLGIQLSRNLTQTRNGGADCVDLGRIRLEVKRQERLNITSWWEQAERQSLLLVTNVTNNNKGKRLIPTLAYRQNRKPWVFVLDASDVIDLKVRGHLLHMDIDAFCAIVLAKGYHK